MDAKAQLDRFIVGVVWTFVWFMVGYVVANRRNAIEVASLPPIVVEPGDCIELNDGREPVPRRHYRSEIVGATKR